VLIHQPIDSHRTQNSITLAPRNNSNRLNNTHQAPALLTNVQRSVPGKRSIDAPNTSTSWQC